MKKRTIACFGIIISLVFIFFILRNIDLREVKETFFRIKYIYILPVLAVYLCSFLFRSWRWKYLLEHEKVIKIKGLFPILMIGFMANQILPARIGEFVRAYCLGKKERISKSLSFGTIVMERLWDGLTLLFFLTVIFTLFPLPRLFGKIHLIGAAIFAGILLCIVFLTFKKKGALRFLKKCLSFLPEAAAGKLSGYLDTFIDGFKVLKNKRHLFLVTFISICIWLIEGLSFFILTRAFSFPIPFYGVILIIILINVGVMIPASPGYIGTFEGFCILGLSFFGISKGPGLGFAIILHAILSIPIIIIGLACLWKENISWAEIKET